MSFHAFQHINCIKKKNSLGKMNDQGKHSLKVRIKGEATDPTVYHENMEKEWVMLL